MTHGDLFTGIGGFALAVTGMGWRTAWMAEVDPWASKLLAQHWPAVPNLGDVRQIDYAAVEPVDLLTAGFPCQPHSVAGKQRASDDPRDLSGEVIRAIRTLRPRYALLENVPGLRRSEGGAFFRRFLGALAAVGYDAEWVTLAASDVGAPHPRERLWIVAYPHGQSVEPVLAASGPAGEGALLPAGPLDPLDASGGGPCAWPADVADRQQPRLEGQPRHGAHGGQPGRIDPQTHGPVGASGLRGRGIGVGGWLPEPDVCRVAHGIPHRVDRIRGLGNAIVPQCAAYLLALIAQHAESQGPAVFASCGTDGPVSY